MRQSDAGRCVHIYVTYADACMQISAQDGVDKKEEWYKGLCNVEDLSTREQEEMLSMCGVPRLMKALQALQTGHMMSHSSDVLAKILEKLAELQPRIQVCGLGLQHVIVVIADQWSTCPISIELVSASSAVALQAVCTCLAA